MFGFFKNKAVVNDKHDFDNYEVRFKDLMSAAVSVKIKKFGNNEYLVVETKRNFITTEFVFDKDLCALFGTLLCSYAKSGSLDECYAVLNEKKQ